MSIGYFQWTKIGCFRWTRSGERLSFCSYTSQECGSKTLFFAPYFIFVNRSFILPYLIMWPASSEATRLSLYQHINLTG